MITAETRKIVVHAKQGASKLARESKGQMKLRPAASAPRVKNGNAGILKKVVNMETNGSVKHEYLE